LFVQRERCLAKTMFGKNGVSEKCPLRLCNLMKDQIPTSAPSQHVGTMKSIAIEERVKAGEEECIRGSPRCEAG